MSEERTVAAVLARNEARLRTELGPMLRRAGLPWPSPRLSLVVYKEERRLDIWAHDPARRRRVLLVRLPILAASGVAGPKRREGDLQVPEGIYRLTALNPQSRFHLSVRVDYPNAEDRVHAIVPREKLGGDIYLHGNAISIGCVAIGDTSIETVFALVARTGLSRCRAVLVPWDLAVRPAPTGQPAWLSARYRRLRRALLELTPPAR